MYIVIGVVAVAVIALLFMRNNNSAMKDNSDSMKSDDSAMMNDDSMNDDSMMDDSMMDDSSSDNSNNNMENGVMVGGAMMTPDKDIVDNAVNSNDHTTLVAAVKAAGLVDTLKGDGPFTVFAPTNDAFNKLPAGTVEDLVKPENKDMLTKILTYHVVSGRYTSDMLKDGMQLKTVEGEMLTFNEKDGQWWINGSAMITTADVISSNGVTYVIDTVLMPK